MGTLFTKIIAGDIPSFKVYEDAWTFAFLTKDAVHLGHTLIVPKLEVDYFIDVPEPFFSKVFENSKILARAIHGVTGCKRVGTLIAGWEVPHFHYHLIPMFHAADLDLRLGKERTREENLRIQAELRIEIDRLRSSK
jgi:histidine triad (HIT) family protein